MSYILFDLDGTLTDSGKGIIHCAQLTLSHYQLPVPTAEQMRSMVGPPLRDSFLRFGIAEKDLPEAVAFYRRHYLATGQYENAPYPGIAELLSHLMMQGHILCVATSKPEEMAKAILEHFSLAKYFTHICGAASDHSRNTKEAVIAHLLTKLPENAKMTMVGDTIFDVRGAAYHHIPCIAVSWGYGVEEDMLAAGAVIAHSMQELENLLQ